MHAAALTEEGAVLFPRLARFAGFYLAGGTSLALQLGHRQSVDFDLFRDDALPDRLLTKVKRTFADFPVIVTYHVPGQLNVVVGDVKMTFFHYGYPPVERFVHYRNVPLLSVRELAATKAFSLGKRLAYKDYVDWYFLLSEKRVRLREVIALAKKKYGNDFNDRLFLSQLVSLDEVHSSPINFLRKPVDRASITRTLENTVRRYRL